CLLCFLCSSPSLCPYLDAGLGKRGGAQFQEKIRCALSNHLWALIIVVLEAGGSDSVCNTQWSLAVLIKDIHLCALFGEKLDDGIDALVGRSVQRRPSVFPRRIDVGPQAHQELGDLE